MIEVTPLGTGSPLPDPDRAGPLVLTHYVPALVPGTEDEWRAIAAQHFDGRVEVGDDLHTVEIG